MPLRPTEKPARNQEVPGSEWNVSRYLAEKTGQIRIALSESRQAYGQWTTKRNFTEHAMTALDFLVAVATKSGQQIDLHFGHADAFAIYHVSGGSVAFHENRAVEHYCQGGYGDDDKREAILRALADCRAVFLARVGDGPAKRLREAGIEPVTAFPYGEPVESIANWLSSQ